MAKLRTTGSENTAKNVRTIKHPTPITVAIEVMVTEFPKFIQLLTVSINEVPNGLSLAALPIAISIIR